MAPMHSAPELVSLILEEVNEVAHVAITPAIAIVTAISRTEAINGETPFFLIR